MIDMNSVSSLHTTVLGAWIDGGPDAVTPMSPFQAALLENHRYNYRLWLLEDSARDPNASDAAVGLIKRQIDKVNQLRNDAAQRIDDACLAELVQNIEAPIHSESLGLMIDRLSIMTLKCHFTRQQIYRTDAPAGHADRNRERLRWLLAQHTDLSRCLIRDYHAAQNGELRFKVYRQLKMYNDPQLNPAIYNASKENKAR